MSTSCHSLSLLPRGQQRWQSAAANQLARPTWKPPIAAMKSQWVCFTYNQSPFPPLPLTHSCTWSHGKWWWVRTAVEAKGQTKWAKRPTEKKKTKERANHVGPREEGARRGEGEAGERGKNVRWAACLPQPRHILLSKQAIKDNSHYPASPKRHLTPLPPCPCSCCCFCPGTHIWLGCLRRCDASIALV